MARIQNTVTLEKGLRAEFLRAFAAAETMVPKLATIVDSSASDEKYAWLGEVPAVSEFLDERQIKGFTDTSYTITNKTWEATIAVKRSEIEDDQTGGITTRINDLATRARQHTDELLFSALTTGTTDLGYDGVSFFNDAHPARTPDASAQDNSLGGTGTTTAAFQTDFRSAVAALKKFTDERGKPFWPMIRPSDLMVVVPPDLEYSAKEALNATIVSNTSNVLVGAAGDVLVSPWLTATNDWYLLYTGGPVRPLIFQDRMGVEFKALEGETESGFLRETYLYGTRSRYNVGYGLWQAAVKTTN